LLLGAGDVTRSPFANSFLRIFVREELSLRLGVGLARAPDSLARRTAASEVVVLAPRLHPGTSWIDAAATSGKRGSIVYQWRRTAEAARSQDSLVGPATAMDGVWLATVDNLTLRRSSLRDSANGSVSARARQSPSGRPDAMVTSVDDEARELIEQMAVGHLPALERLYDGHAHLVFPLALRILRNQADAEEVTQEVFLQVWREASRYDPARGTPQAWIVMLARARAIDKLRAVRRLGDHRREAANVGRTEVPSARGTADQVADRQLVLGVLANLSSAERQMLELAYYEGLTQTEIAARTGVPLGTVKTRIRMGLEQLRTALNDKRATAL
jgi:RNA polymerase sigma-70 factor (ECF subfamily)